MYSQLGGCTQTGPGQTSPPLPGPPAPNGLLAGGLKNSSTNKLSPQSLTVPRFSAASPTSHNRQALLAQQPSKWPSPSATSAPIRALRRKLPSMLFITRPSSPAPCAAPYTRTRALSHAPLLLCPPRPHFLAADASPPERRRTPLPTTLPSPHTRSSPMCRASRKVRRNSSPRSPGCAPHRFSPLTWCVPNRGPRPRRRVHLRPGSPDPPDDPGPPRQPRGPVVRLH